MDNVKSLTTEYLKLELESKFINVDRYFEIKSELLERNNYDT
jgi:hypothetical protein